MLRHLRNFGLAFTLSAAALLATLVLQALLLFRGPLTRLGNPVPPRIDRLSICDDGRRALLFIREPMVLERDSIRYTMALFSTMEPLAPLSLPTRSFIPRSIAGARSAPFAFVATTAGDLYSLDLRRNPSPPIRFGQHRAAFPNVLAGTDDGALVVAANDSISCWDRAAARCLWRRGDCELTLGMFVPGTHRFFAVLTTGKIVELDSHSGVTLRELASHCDFTVNFDISPDCEHLAAINPYGACVVSELGANEQLWSRQFPVPAVVPRFSPSGRILIAADQQRRPQVALLSAASGRLLGELTGARAEIVGLAISPQGAVYAWDLTGTVSVWDLASRSLLFQFHPGKSI